MKKKLCALTLFASMLLLGHCNDVQAAEIKASDVPNNTYIIGTHMFSEEVVLTTKHIMLGATTIESDKLSDMTIYYKTPRGAWIDGLSGDTVTVPTNFDVDYIDTVLQVTNPVISSSEEVSDTDDSHGKKYNLVLDKIDNMTGVQLYSSASEDGEYTLLKDYKIEEITNNSIEVEVKGGYNYFFKVKSYKTVSDTKYSEFSNIVNIDNSLQYSNFGGVSGGYIPKEGEDQTHDRAFYFDVDDFITKLGNKPDRMEIYFSLEKDGEYTLIDDIAYEDLLVLEGDSVRPEGNLGFSYAAVPGYTNYLKIRSYIKYGDETVYSDFGYATKNEDLDTPWISKAQGLVVENDLHPIDLYLDKVYPDFRVRPVGVEVYYSTEEDGEYTLLTTVALTEMRVSEGDYIAKVNVPLNNKYYIKVRNYAEVKGEKVFGEFSNIQDTNAIYTVTYNLDGGSNIYQEGKSMPPYYIAGSSEINIAQPKKSGYVFIGWTGSNGDTPEMDVAITKETTGALEFTAHWAKESFTVKYNKNNDNATGTMEDTTCTYGTTCNLSASEFVLENYEVIGWATTADGEVEYELGADVSDIVLTDKDSITLYAVWGLKRYDITYNLDGGSAENNPTYFTSETDDTDTVAGQQIYVEYPTKEGYTFEGWTGTGFERTSPNLASTEGCWLTITDLANLELTATWERIEWRIMYSAGNGVSYSGEKMEDTYFDYSETGTLRTNTMQRKGYDFAGWATEEGGEVVYTDGQSGITLEYHSLYGYGITLWAVWVPTEYNITYDLGENGYVTYPYNPTTYTIEDSITLKTPTRVGYTFTGWTGANGETLQESVSIAKGTTGNLTYTANWELKTYSLTYFVKTPDKTENITDNYKVYGYQDNYYTEYITVNGTLPTEYSVESESINLTELFTAKEGYSLKFYTREAVTVEGQQAQEIQFVELTEFPKTYHIEVNGEDIENKSTGNEYIYIEVIANN